MSTNPPPPVGLRVTFRLDGGLEPHGIVAALDEANGEAVVKTLLLINGVDTFRVPLDRLKAA